MRLRPGRPSRLQRRHSDYGARLQALCRAQDRLDWHGFTLGATLRGSYSCSGGTLFTGNRLPRPMRLAYGRSWRHGAFTCVSRVTGLTCTSRSGHGLFLSRESWRGW